MHGYCYNTRCIDITTICARTSTSPPGLARRMQRCSSSTSCTVTNGLSSQDFSLDAHRDLSRTGKVFIFIDHFLDLHIVTVSTFVPSLKPNELHTARNEPSHRFYSLKRRHEREARRKVCGGLTTMIVSISLSCCCSHHRSPQASACKQPAKPFLPGRALFVGGTPPNLSTLLPLSAVRKMWCEFSAVL